MKHIEISDDTYQAIASRHANVDAFIEQAAKRQLAEQDRQQQQEPEELVERFRKYRGMLKGVTVEDIVESRHMGLL